MKVLLSNLLTYNYGIRNNENGNDLNYFQIESTRVLDNVKRSSYTFKELTSKSIEINDPNGYRFIVKKVNKDPSICALVNISDSSLKERILLILKKVRSAYCLKVLLDLFIGFGILVVCRR